MKFVLPLLVFASLASAADTYDVVVYGGTSGGVTAAIQASRLGKTVVLVEPTKFLGGLTTGGLGATDIGNKKAIGGMSREFYQRVFKHYANPTSWVQQTRDDYFKNKPHGNSAVEDTMWTFEPKVATKIYDDMLKESKAVVVFGERLNLKSGVVKEGTKITKLVMESGRAFEGKMFIDATYEGDVMAKAGVSYHVGREANSLYGETINGLQTAGARSHQFNREVDPYVKKGDPSSGLLPFITPAPEGEDGSGDHRIQAYNFRMCTTDDPANRLDWVKPANYREQDFELALRNVEAGDTRIQWNPVPMPNRKTDTNNNFAIASDFIGQNYDYPEADYATRDKIIQAHKDWQLGLFWTYAHHPRVPEKIREAYQRFGLAKDEFLDSGNWPRQLYVREARRMVSDYVMSEKNCRRKEVIEDSVGMGAYNMDSHHTQRYVTKEGFVRNEGDIQIGTRPYPISYRSIRPKADQCTNLLVPICLAASHIAYGSIRMEPVFMVMGQSAATAAVHAIDQNTTVQGIDYAKLKEQMLKDGQMLDFESPPMPDRIALSKEKVGGIVVDDADAKLTGFDSHGHTTSPYVDEGYAHDSNEAKGEQKARFVPNLPKAGKYRVAIAYTALANRATNVPVTIHTADGAKTITVNQKKKPTINGLLFPLGTFQFEAGKAGYVEISNVGTDGYVIIDAVQWLVE